MDGLRLHVGSATIYLLPDENGPWVNVDLFESGAALAKDCPGGVEKWGTVESDYYGHLKHIDAALLGEVSYDHETVVCDAYGSWSNLPFEDETVVELLSRQCFEHLSKTEARYALAEARRVMKLGGVLRLDVPDHEATLAEYAHLITEATRWDVIDPDTWEAIQSIVTRRIMKLGVPEKAEIKRKAAFMLRHLLGSRKNDWAYHMGSWTRERLISFCKSYGFQFVSEERNIHFYPAFCLRFQKVRECDFHELDDPIHPWKAAWEYCGEGGGPLTACGGMNVLEVGPGMAPWPRANFYCDIVDRPGLNQFSIGDVQSLPYENKSMDFVLTSHVLEHVADPVKAASELSRVAHAGCVVCPSPWKEGMLLFHEQDHKWSVFAGKDCLYFKKIPEGLYPRLYNADLSGQCHRFWRYGDRRLEGLANKAKRYFHEVEPLVDTIWHWRHTLRIEVLE